MPTDEQKAVSFCKLKADFAYLTLRTAEINNERILRNMLCHIFKVFYCRFGVKGDYNKLAFVYIAFIKHFIHNAGHFGKIKH